MPAISKPVPFEGVSKWRALESHAASDNIGLIEGVLEKETWASQSFWCFGL